MLHEGHVHVLVAFDAQLAHLSAAQMQFARNCLHCYCVAAAPIWPTCCRSSLPETRALPNSWRRESRCALANGVRRAGDRLIAGRRKMGRKVRPPRAGRTVAKPPELKPPANTQLGANLSPSHCAWRVIEQHGDYLAAAGRKFSVSLLAGRPACGRDGHRSSGVSGATFARQQLGGERVSSRAFQVGS